MTNPGQVIVDIDMSIFTTDHPPTSQPSLSDVKVHPLLSAVGSAIILALGLTPAILAGLYFYFTSDIGAEANPFPNPWLDLTVGSMLSFAISIVCTSAMVATYRRLTRMRTKPDALSHRASLK